MTSTTDIARRPNGHAPAAQQSSAVAIRTGQAEFDDKQKAALVAMGVSAKVTRAELAVFFHQCRQLRLDPFTRQIYLIHRRTREGDKWVEKPTTQIGIDGFRVTRDRIADEKGLKVEYEDTLWYGDDGTPCDVWLWDEPPAACKFVVLVDGRRFPSVLRFNEYCQKNKDGDRLGRWRDGFAHQIEKCAEADALRRAFPNDLSGVILEDAAPLDDPDAPPPVQRSSAADIRARAPRPQQPSAPGVVDAQIVDEAPWPAEAAPAPVAADLPPHDDDPRAAAHGHLNRLGIAGHENRMNYVGQLLDIAPPASLESLARVEAVTLTERLALCPDKDALDVLLKTGEVPGGN